MDYFSTNRLFKTILFLFILLESTENILFTIPWKQVYCHPKKNYKPKPITTTQPISTSTHIWTLPLPSHTTPSLSMTPVASPSRYVMLFPACTDPLRSDAALCCLSRSILVCAALWYMLLLCAALPCSVPPYDSWHCSVPPVLLCASPCRSFQICASMCQNATPKTAPIMIRNSSFMPKSRMKTAKFGIP